MTRGMTEEEVQATMKEVEEKAGKELQKLLSDKQRTEEEKARIKEALDAQHAELEAHNVQLEKERAERETLEKRVKAMESKLLGGIFASSQRRQSSRQSTSSKVTWPMPQSRDHNDSLDRAADAVRDAVRMADSLSLVSPFAAKGSAPPPPPPSFRPAAQQQHDTTASRLLQGFSSTAYSSTPLPTYTTPSALLAQSAPRPSAAWAPREEAKHRRSGTGERGVARALATSALAAAEASSAYRISTIRTSPPKAYTIIGNTAHRRPSSAGGVAALLARGATSALRPPPAPLSRVPAWEGTPQTPRSQLFNFSSHSKGAASAAHSSRERSPSPAKGGKISTLEKDPRVSPGYNASPGGQRSPLRAGTGGGGGAGGGSPAGAAAREIRGGGDSWAREELRSKEREITRLQEEVKRGHARLADALKSAEATTSAFLAKGAEELETVKSERNNLRREVASLRSQLRRLEKGGGVVGAQPTPRSEGA